MILTSTVDKILEDTTNILAGQGINGDSMHTTMYSA